MCVCVYAHAWCDGVKYTFYKPHLKTKEQHWLNVIQSSGIYLVPPDTSLGPEVFAPGRLNMVPFLLFQDQEPLISAAATLTVGKSLSVQSKFRKH